MTDPIKDALRAAALALYATQNGVKVRFEEMSDLEQAVMAELAPDKWAAAAVAAFLLHLAPRWRLRFGMMDGETEVGEIDVSITRQMRDLAAAVEKAARDE